MIDMKKIIFATLGLITLMLQACYDDYKDDFDYTTTYFALQNQLRTLVVEEGKDLSTEIGVMLGGVYSNTENHNVSFEVDPSMLDLYPQLNILPAQYYTLSNDNAIEIPKGEVLGKVLLTLNENFINDVNAHKQHYALPLRILSSDVDSILDGKDSTIIALRYQNQYYGQYWLKGIDYTLDASNQIISEFAYSNDDLVNNINLRISTLAIDSCYLPYAGVDQKNNALKLKISNGEVEVLGDEDINTFSNITGNGKYDKDNKIFTLDYTYENQGVTHHVKDTLYYFHTPMSVEYWQ